MFISFLKGEEEGIEEWRKLLSFSFSLSSSVLGRLEKGNRGRRRIDFSSFWAEGKIDGKWEDSVLFSLVSF